MRALLGPLVLLIATGCGAASAPTAARAPEPPAPAPAVVRVRPAPTGDPFAVEGSLGEEVYPLLKTPVADPAWAHLPAAPAGLAPAPASCAELAARRAEPTCPLPGPRALEAIDKALAESDPGKRDAALAASEGCAAPGVVRALRADLAPVECAEAIVAPVLAAPPASITGSTYGLLAAQALGSRLARAATTPPVLEPPYERARVLAFTKGPMAAWFAEQARAIEATSQLASSLPPYARGVAAIEAGMADLRVVEAVRSAPLPDDLTRDQALRDEYYLTLDQALDPRKDRGRDAALVGLRELAAAGVLRDARVDRARKLLSRLYGGRRVDALDALVLPPLPPATPSSLEERLARALPTYFAGVLLDPAAAAKPGVLRMLLERGVPLPARAALHGAALTPGARGLYARARLESARLYWRAVDVDEAVAIASAWPADQARPDDVALTLALALALRHGPEDAAELVRKAPLATPSMGSVAALDAIAGVTPPGALSGAASFDAALIRQIAVPESADAAYWSDVALRYREAATLLTDAADRARALERAEAADATARAIRPARTGG